MEDSDKWDNCKKEIRSILIPYQKGCYLPEFNKTYRDLIGKRLPAREFGYSNEIDFLYSMPDVVRITHTRTGEYHLLGIADESSKHIQKMVSRQKPAKLKPPPPRTFRSRSYILPPRFSEIQRVPEPKLPQRTFARAEPKPKAKEALPNRPASSRLETGKSMTQSSGMETFKSMTQSSSKLNPEEEVILLVKSFKNRLALDDLMDEYKRMYKRSLSLSQYGFSSIEECVESISELDIVRRNNVNFVVHCSEVEQYASNNEVINAHEATSAKQSPEYITPEPSSMFISNNIENQRNALLPSPEISTTFSSDYSEAQSCDVGNVPITLRRKFQMIADRFNDGIWASEFPDYFEEVTSEPLDYLILGYRCLSDLIDDVPDIFIRKPVAGSRKDYIIYPANKFKQEDDSLFVEHIVMNIRKILEAYPEGIKIKDILHVYGINCKDTLHIEDLGFDNLEAFLSSIKNSIPFRFGMLKGEKSIHLRHNFTPENISIKPEKNENWRIPSDAVTHQFEYQTIVLPDEFEYTKFMPVYVSSVAHPGHLYIQFPSGETVQNYVKMSDEMGTFYNGSQSEWYMMKTVHITEQFSCIAKWPVDNQWYRAQILSIPSLGTVKVHYVDYGTRDIISTKLLRYAKKEYIDLPVQAVRCRLSFVKPPNNAENWNMEARNRILNLCRDIPLMAKFEMGSDGVFSIVLCDTNGDDDIYINDVLHQEGLADYDLADNNKNVSPSPEPVVQLECRHNINSLQALQAQYFLKAFATVAPSFAQNEHYLALLREITVYTQMPDPVQQSIGMPIMPPVAPAVAPVAPPGFTALPPIRTTHSNTSALYNTCPTITTALEGLKTKANAANPDHFVKPPVDGELVSFSNSSENPAVGNGEIDNDIFEDDDDEIFQQFCQKVSVENVRHVKRVILGDGYKIHVIVVDSTPYCSSGDISQLIWNNKEADYLIKRLSLKDTEIPSMSLSEDGNEELFQQLRRLDVKGVQNTTGFNSSIYLFPMKNVVQILNLFGHPSITLRIKLNEEISSFNPNDDCWQEFSVDSVEADEDNNTSVTDDDKIGKLCLYDLRAMKESIMCKKKKMMFVSNSGSKTHREEINKLELLQSRVLQRIQEIEEICEEFK